MIKPKSLNSLMREKGLTDDDLNQPIKCEHCDQIAILLGQDWESLATSIGFGKYEIDDIKEEYHNRKPKDRRIALLREWKKKFGSDATYAKMVHGLETIDNRELTEIVMKLCSECKVCNSAEPHYVDNADIKNHNTSAGCIPSIAFSLVLVVIYLPLICCFVFEVQRDMHMSIILHEMSHVHTNSTMTLWSPKFQKGTNCSQGVGHDLPLLPGLFIGREDDIEKVIGKAKKANILNINGAPGFGKSTLAIQTGYSLVQNCISVRYINIEELSWKILAEFTNSKKNFTTEKKSMGSKSNQKQQRALTAFTDSQIANKDGEDSGSSNYFESSYVSELQEWSKSLNQTTFLIFDNADFILTGSLRGKFINIATLLIRHSNFHLHVIIVSQEKLLLLENFDRWTVRQLSQQASMELLNKLAPDIASNLTTEIAELLQGCPLALKVIGSILNIYGESIIPELEYELQQQPISVLDKVSDQRQRFSIMMDLVLSKLKFLEKCGYAVSLFPGSFSREAGTLILSKECLEQFEKHSLLDEYFFGNQHRYIMHRLIREHLKEKINESSNIIFQKRFCAYFSQFVLNHTYKEPYVNQHELLSESTNLDSLEEILLANSNTNVLDNIISQELAALIILLSKGFAQFENKWRPYIRFKESYHGEFLNSVMYSRLISYTVKHLYKKSKCDTVKEYFQRISDYPSKDIFDCKLATQLCNMRSHLNFSQEEEQFLYNVQTLQCSHTSLLLFLYKYIRNGFLLAIAIILISCHNFKQYCQTILRSLSHYKDKARLPNHVTCTAALIFVLLLLIPFTYYKIFDIVLIIEVIVKLFCYPCNDIVTTSIIFFLILYCYRFYPSFFTTHLVLCYSKQCTMCLFVSTFIGFLVMFLIQIIYHVDICSAFPICH